MPAKRKEINSCAFAEDFVSGDFTYRQLARKYQISLSLVGKIVSGKRRPEISEAIDQLIKDANRDTRRCWRGLRHKAVATLGNAMKGTANGTAVTAAKEVLNRTEPEPEADDALPVYLERTLMDLSDKTKRRVLRELGGPEL